MRENIGLFRGKRIDNGEWVEGNLLGPDAMFNEWYIVITEGFCRAVDPDTVGECTGLKDKNGKLIFEGDIVRYGLFYDYNCFLESLEHPEEYDNEVYDDDIEIDYVQWGGEWEYPAFDLANHNFESNGLSTIASGDYEYEIIGNIHDNPELLKGGDGWWLI